MPVESRHTYPLMGIAHLRALDGVLDCLANLERSAWRRVRRTKIVPEKPPTPPATERAEQSAGVVALQDAKVPTVRQPAQRAWHESSNGHGTAQNGSSRLVEPVRDFTSPLLSQLGWVYDPLAQGTDYAGQSEAAGL